MTPPRLRPLIWIEARIEADDVLDGCRLLRYWGGSFGGYSGLEGLTGAVVGGADHGRSRRDGLRACDARLVLEAGDGTPLALYLQGLGPACGPWPVSGWAEVAGDSALAWLNAQWLVGQARRRDDTERWELFACEGMEG